MRTIRRGFLLLTLFTLASNLLAQQSSTTVPNLVRYGGVLKDAQGAVMASRTVGTTFLIYGQQEGGAPVWLETQNVATDAAGQYSVLLGSTTATGLPTDLFAQQEQRWLAVKVEEQPERPRVLLVSVPYALKAGDAETLGGLPASAFALAAPGNVVSSSPTTPATSTTAPGVLPPGTITGIGTAGFLPDFTGTTTIGNSAVFQSGASPTAKIGINTNAPATNLDVNGGAVVRGTFSLPATGTATATAGKNSQPENLAASAFNSGTSTAVTQTFQLKAEPVGNDTATPSGSLNLLFGQGTSAPAETGFKISSKGILTFATGQTFPGTGTVRSVGSGPGLTGGPITTTGTLSIANAGVTNTMLANPALTINAGTDLLGGGLVSLGGSTTLNLDTAKVAQLNTANTFTGNQTINGNVSATGLVTGNAYNIGSNLFAFGSYTSGNAFLGFAGNTTTTGTGNIASGFQALSFNTTGSYNIASGFQALISNSTGFYNIAIGREALFNNTTGSGNIAIGDQAAVNLTSGDNNVHIGNPGLSSESNTIRIGAGGVHTAFYVAGVNNTVVMSGQEVFIGSDDRLGTVLSSRRYKEDIRDMDAASDGLLKLRPVTFRYKQSGPDGSKPLQYGLIAEEVAEIYPDAVSYNAAGEPDAVQYHKINAMLLNELLKQHHRAEAQAKVITAQQNVISTQQQQIGSLQKQNAEFQQRLSRLETLLGAQVKVAQATAAGAGTQ